MKAKITYSAKATMLLVVFATLMLGTGAHAQTAVFSGKFTLSYQVHWGQAMLPAGDYSIRFSSIHSPAVIRSMDGKIAVFVATAARSQDSEKGPSSLTIVTRGDERKVVSMNLPEARVSLVYSPLTKAERESLAKGNQIQTVPLSAKK